MANLDEQTLIAVGTVKACAEQGWEGSVMISEKSTDCSKLKRAFEEELGIPL